MRWQRVQDAIDSMNNTGNAGDDIIADSGAGDNGATITIEDVAVDGGVGLRVHGAE